MNTEEMTLAYIREASRSNENEELYTLFEKLIEVAENNVRLKEIVVNLSDRVDWLETQMRRLTGDD